MKFFPSYLPVLVAILAFCCSGCAVKARDVSYYVFDYPTPTKEVEAPVRETLMVYRFLLSSDVPSDNLVILESKGTEQSYYKFRWEENPADMISELLLRDIQNSGLFEKVVDQLSSVRYRYALEATIRKMQGVVQDGQSKAVIEMDAALTDFEAPPGKDKTVFRKTYKIEAPSTGPKPENIIKALNSAIKELSGKLRGDMKIFLERSGLLEIKIPKHIPNPAETKYAVAHD